MAVINRVLDPEPIDTLDAYVAIGGGAGLEAARRLEGIGIIEEVTASGLRGRGGGGFPTGTKWASIAAAPATLAPTVIVNAAEGEPGSFKDRALLRRNPYRILEGALIAATAVGADRIVVGLKRSFVRERRRLASAIGELRAAGWLDNVEVCVVLGPSEYLFGEETGLLEVIEGRQPFPRIAPPYRRGLGAAPDSVDEEPWDEDQGLVLANNVETLANVPGIVMQGAAWFRSLGTNESPGTIVCTVSGDTARDGVGEVALGTPIREIIDEIGGGARPGQRLVAALSGVANAFLPESMFDTPATYEALAAAGSGLGAAGFLVFDDSTDLVAVAHGVAQFLAVESCGQCEPCKRDGLAIAVELDGIAAFEHGRGGDRPARGSAHHDHRWCPLQPRHTAADRDPEPAASGSPISSRPTSMAHRARLIRCSSRRFSILSTGTWSLTKRNRRSSPTGRTNRWTPPGGPPPTWPTPPFRSGLPPRPPLTSTATAGLWRSMSPRSSSMPFTRRACHELRAERSGVGVRPAVRCS